MGISTVDAAALTALVERLETAQAKLTPQQLQNHNRTEQMLQQQQPPGTSMSRGTENKPFSLHRFLSGYMAHKNEKQLCPHEHDTLSRYTKALVSSNCALLGATPGGVWFPKDINEDFGGALVNNSENEGHIAYVKAVMDATRPSYDPDEAAWLERKKFIKSGQSAYIDSVGGSLIAPPIQGEVIPLIRPNAAFLAAGARSVTMPPNGRMVFPKVTGAPDVKALGEGQVTEESDLTTGFLQLQAKKIGGLVKMTEEASAFTSGTMDAIAQYELGRSLGLRSDAYAFYGVGNSEIPAGITAAVYANQIAYVPTINSTALGITDNGNKLLPQYGDIFPSIIEERSFGVEDGVIGAWVMRPAAYATAVALRGDAVVAGDQAGPKVDILRRFSSEGPSTWSGRRVVRTTNLVNNRTKGSSGATLSDVFFGIWQYGIMATYAAINFQQGHNGTTFERGQYLIRGTMFGDIGYTYPEAFLWYPDVLGLTDNW